MLRAKPRPADVFARTIYGEAEPRNEQDAISIAWVIKNRAGYPNWPDDLAFVCLQPWQFSCWNPSDPNRARILRGSGPWFDRCRAIAAQVRRGDIPDPTSRSTHYYATFVPEPKWAKGHTPVYEVKHRNGHRHLFFNDIDTPAPKAMP